MDAKLTGKRPNFGNRGPRSNPTRVILWLGLIAAGIWAITQISTDESARIRPLFLATPTPTRTAGSYLMEAAAYFDAGNIENTDEDKSDAIRSYRSALELDPGNAQVWAELARLLTYSSSLLSTEAERYIRMEEAREAVDTAVELSPDDSTVQAIKALVYDWSSSVAEDSLQQGNWLSEAEQAAVIARNLNPDNYLALAYYAEVLLDQNQWAQALEYSELAVTLAPNSMDTHRVYAIVQESLGQYRVAIEEYEKAANINPNLTFLYIRIGVIYRELPVYDRALEYFDKAITINNSNGVEDPIPYISIAKTYVRMGEFFVAALNAEKALTIDPYNANTYGQLGTVYSKARNYESAMPVLECAVLGCSVERANEILAEILPYDEITLTAPVEKLPITNLEVAYYYAQYSSVLAALSRPSSNNCPRALEVGEMIRDAFPDDVSLMSIVSVNESICRLVEETQTP